MFRQDEDLGLQNKQQELDNLDSAQQGSTGVMLYKMLYGGLQPGLRLPPPMPVNVLNEDNNPAPLLSQEELIAQAEEERRQREEEHREWIKHQAYLITQEEQNEKQRCKNFDDHVYLVNHGQGQSYEFLNNRIGSLMHLADPIPRFTNSIKQGLPRRSPQYGGDSLFDIILLNSNLTSAHKFELILRLLDLGYKNYYLSLLTNPLVQPLVEDDTFNLLLEHLYLWALRDGKMEQDPIVETLVWQKLIANNKGCLVFDVILETTQGHFNKIFDYLEVWLNALDSPDDIIRRCEYAEKAIVNPLLLEFAPDIYKIGKLRVFDIVVERIRENREQYNEYLRAPDPNGMLSRALNFLNMHRRPLMKGGFGATKSSSIYDMIPVDLDIACQMHSKEKVRFWEGLRLRLSVDKTKRSILSYFRM